MRRVRVSSSVPSRATSSAALRARCAPRRATSTIPLDLVIPKPAPAGGPRVIQPNASSAQRAPAISEEEFAKAMEPLRVISGQTLAIAVSGGPDSMALTLLLNRWATASRVRLVGITIDHRFREESAAEAKLVREWLANLGIAHQTCDIQWDRNMTPGQRLNLARVERYRMLIEKAREFNAHTLCVGHHKDDQIETFLMRLSLMSGLDGLGCMTSRTLMNRFPLVRPLLSFSKDQLRATCAAFNQAYVEDPSNEYEYQLRARSRVFVDKLAEQGFNTDELLPLIEHIGHLRDSAAEKVEEFLLNKFIVDTQFGFGCTRRSFLRLLPRAVLQRVLVRLVMYFGGRVYPPSLYAINMLMERIMSDAADFPAFTAGNCYVFQDVGHAPSLYFAPEGVGRKYKGVPVASGETVVIDNVWSVSYKHERGEPGCVVYLDPKNWSTFVRRVPRLMELQRLPPRCRLLPIVLSADRSALLAIPYENIFRERGVTATAAFRSPVTLFRDRDVGGDVEEPVEAR